VQFYGCLAKEMIMQPVKQAVYEFIETHRSKIKPEQQTEEYINNSLRRNKFKVFPENYSVYGFSVILDGYTNRVKILYDDKTKRAYILNKGYSFDKISLITEFSNMDLYHEFNKSNISNFATVIFDYYSFVFGLTAHEADYHLGRNIIPKTISEEELKNTFFWPEMKISFEDKKWSLKFVAYVIDGSIRTYHVKGVIKDDILMIEKIEEKELYPKGTVHVSTV